MDLGEIEHKVLGWIHLAQHRDKWRESFNTIRSLQIP